MQVFIQRQDDDKFAIYEFRDGHLKDIKEVDDELDGSISSE